MRSLALLLAVSLLGCVTHTTPRFADTRAEAHGPLRAGVREARRTLRPARLFAQIRWKRLPQSG
jgi:hypothetical protein